MLTDFQKQILDGAMLGDGSLILHRGARNVYFQYLSSIKEHVEYIFQYFTGLCNYDEVKSGSYFDKRTNKTYTRYWFRTKMLPIFTEQYDRWYSNNKKIIPDDLILTKVNCLIWYIGDGHLVKMKMKNNSKRGGGNIQLSTDCFSVYDITNILIPQMTEYSPTIHFSDGLPRLIIQRKNVRKYLDYLGTCPIACFQYKWDVVPYEYAAYQDGIEQIPQNIMESIIVDYINGDSYYKIAKRLSLNARRIQYLLHRNGHYVPKRDVNIFLMSPIEVDKMIEMRNNGYKWKHFEELYGVTRQTLHKLIKKRL